MKFNVKIFSELIKLIMLSNQISESEFQYIILRFLTRILHFIFQEPTYNRFKISEIKNLKILNEELNI